MFIKRVALLTVTAVAAAGAGLPITLYGWVDDSRLALLAIVATQFPVLIALVMTVQQQSFWSQLIQWSGGMLLGSALSFLPLLPMFIEAHASWFQITLAAIVIGTLAVGQTGVTFSFGGFLLGLIMSAFKKRRNEALRLAEVFD